MFLTIISLILTIISISCSIYSFFTAKNIKIYKKEIFNNIDILDINYILDELKNPLISIYDIAPSKNKRGLKINDCTEKILTELTVITNKISKINKHKNEKLLFDGIDEILKNFPKLIENYCVNLKENKIEQDKLIELWNQAYSELLKLNILLSNILNQKRGNNE